MRTKVLLCAAVMAASLASSMAQSNVYSLNVVGYYNVTVPANGFFMIANQLNTTNNTLQGLIPVANAGDLFFKYSGGYSGASYDDLSAAWDNPGVTLNPGEGGMYKNVGAAPEVLTFVGEVLQGSLANNVPIGNSIRSSMVPQEGKLTTDLGVPGEAGDLVFVYNGGYAGNAYDDLAGDWDNAGGGGPTIKVGQGFFYKKAVGNVSTSWVRNFTVQ